MLIFEALGGKWKSLNISSSDDYPGVMTPKISLFKIQP